MGRRRCTPKLKAAKCATVAPASATLTGGAHGVPREITQNVVAGKYYPEPRGGGFFTDITKKTSVFSPKWGSNAFPYLYCPGRVSSEWRRIPAKRGRSEIYDDIFDELLSHNIEPVITLLTLKCHYIWYSTTAYGILNRKVVDFFVRLLKSCLNATNIRSNTDDLQ